MLFLLAVSGCDQRQSQATKDQEQAHRLAGSRPETKTLEAAGLVGYDGKQLRKSVDKVLDARDQKNKEVEDAIQESDDQ